MPLLSPPSGRPAYVALLSAFFALFFASSVTHALSCLPCDQSTCGELPVGGCKGSTVPGVCGCCQVCARQRNESCGGPFGLQGTCDQGLTCVIRPLNNLDMVGVCEGHVIALRMGLSSETSLTDEDIKNIVLPQLKEELVKLGLPADIVLKLTNVKDKE